MNSTGWSIPRSNGGEEDGRPRALLVLALGLFCWLLARQAAHSLPDASTTAGTRSQTTNAIVWLEGIPEPGLYLVRVGKGEAASGRTGHIPGAGQQGRTVSLDLNPFLKTNEAGFLLGGIGFVPGGATPLPVPLPADLAPLFFAPLRINQANSASLSLLPGIGPRLAARIVSERERRGGFRQAEDLLQVKGIGEQKLRALKPLITLN